MAVWPLPGPTKVALLGRQVRWAIHGGRNYKVVSAFGTLRCEDASLIRFEEELPEEKLQDLRKQLRGAAKSVRSLSGHDVYASRRVKGLSRDSSALPDCTCERPENVLFGVSEEFRPF